MQIKISKSVFFSILCSVFFVNLLMAGTPQILLNDLVNSIGSANGNITFFFTKGTWVKNVNGKKIIIDFSDNQKANFKFSYDAGQLQDGGRLIFSPAIHVWAKSSSGGMAFNVDTIFYDDNGKFVNWVARPDPRNSNDLSLIGAAQMAIGLDFKSESLLNGKLLKSFYDAKPVDPKTQLIIPGNSPPALREIILKKKNEAEPGLAVSFLPGSVVHFGSKISDGTFDNLVELKAGNFEFRYLDYNLNDKSIDCEISHFEINIESGQLQSKDINIKLASDSKIEFNRLKIFSNNNSSSISCEQGTITGQVTGGTSISLSNTSKYPSNLVLENGAIKLTEFKYECSDDASTAFEMGSQSTLNVNTRSGTLALCDNKGFLSLSTGRLECQLSGNWRSSDPNPDTHLLVSLLQAKFDDGYLPITDDNIVKVKSGFLKSEKLRFDGLNFPSLQGEIKDLQVEIADQTKFTIPDGFQIVFKSGMINGAEPGHPLRLDVTNKYVSGLFQLNLNYYSFSSSSDKKIQLRDGNIKMNLHVLDQHGITADNIYFDGNTTINSDNVSFGCRFQFSDKDLPAGTLKYVQGSEPEFASSFSFTITQSNEIKISTPSLILSESNPEEILFPFNFSFILTQPVVSPVTNISFSGHNITLGEIILNPHFTVIIPMGRGEHADSRNVNSADGNHGPDWAKDCQEIFSAAKVVRRHIYLYPKNHGVSTTMKFSIGGNVIDFGFNKVSFDQSFAEDESDNKDLSKDWKHDGGDLELLGFGLGAIIGVFLSPLPVIGPIAPIVLPIAGLEAGIRGEHLAEDLVNVKLTESITVIDLSRKWQIK